MVEPVKLGNFLLLFSSAAAVVLLGAAYAALFALARLRNHRGLLPLAYLAYAGLLVSATGLAYAANLYAEPLWASLLAVMVGGYLFAPRAILRLCRGVNAGPGTSNP